MSFSLRICNRKLPAGHIGLLLNRQPSSDNTVYRWGRVHVRVVSRNKYMIVARINKESHHRISDPALPHLTITSAISPDIHPRGFPLRISVPHWTWSLDRSGFHCWRHRTSQHCTPAKYQGVFWAHHPWEKQCSWWIAEGRIRVIRGTIKYYTRACMTFVIQVIRNPLEVTSDRHTIQIQYLPRM